ncbi:MAG: condensation domain-containing protein, partial [Frankia sp.]
LVDQRAPTSRPGPGTAGDDDERRAPGGGSPEVPDGPRSPLSFAQQRLWFLRQLAPDDPSYLVSGVIVFDGERAPVESRVLAAALADVVAGHEALRTAFEFDGGSAIARVRPAEPAAGPALEYGVIPDADDLDAGLRRFAERDARTRFDLAAPPLFRARLLRRAGRPVALLVTIHHIVFDGWSFGVLVRDLGRTYEARLRGQRPAPRTTEGPVAFAARQRRWTDSAAGRRALDTLAASLAGAPTVLDLPTDRPRPAVRGSAGGHLERPLGAVTTTAVRRFARRCRASTYMVGLAAFGALLHRWTGLDDLIVGTAFAGRTTVPSEDAIGCFANTVPVRLRPAPGRPFESLVAQARDTALLAMAHQDVPFECLVDRLRVPRDLARTPLVQVAFGVQNASAPVHDGPAASFRGVELTLDHARLDLTLWLTEREQHLSALWTYSADLFRPTTIAGLHDRFEGLLHRAIAHPDHLFAALEGI